MEYKVKGFIVRNDDFSEVEQWINEMAKKGFEVDNLETHLFANGQFNERVVVVMKKKEVVVVNTPLDFKIEANPEATEKDIAKAVQKEIAKTEEQKPKGRSKSKE